MTAAEELGREFQQVFGAYFPHLRVDLDVAFSEADWLLTRVIGNPLETVRRTRAKKDLSKIRTWLLKAGQHDLSYWMPLNFDLHQSMQREDGSHHIQRYAHTIFQFLLDLDGWKKDGTLHRAIDRFIEAAEKAIDETPDTANTNWRAIHAIDCLRILWQRNTGKDGPSKELNSASKFAGFLRDGFQFLEIDADPVSAFSGLEKGGRKVHRTYLKCIRSM